MAIAHYTPKTISTNIHNMCHWSHCIHMYIRALVFVGARKKIRWEKLFSIRNMHNTDTHTHSLTPIDLTFRLSLSFFFFFFFFFVFLSLALSPGFGQYRSEHVIRLSTFVRVWHFMKWLRIQFCRYCFFFLLRNFRSMAFCSLFLCFRRHSHNCVYRNQFIIWIDLSVCWFERWTKFAGGKSRCRPSKSEVSQRLLNEIDANENILK